MVFKHSKKWYFWASWIAWAVGVIFCVLPPIITTLIYFPSMVTKNTNSTISIFFVLGILISVSTILPYTVKALKNNSFLLVFFVLLAITLLLVGVYYMEKKTILGLAWVSGSASVGVLFAMIAFKIGHIWNDLYKNCGEVYVK